MPPRREPISSQSFSCAEERWHWQIPKAARNDAESDGIDLLELSESEKRESSSRSLHLPQFCVGFGKFCPCAGKSVDFWREKIAWVYEHFNLQKLSVSRTLVVKGYHSTLPRLRPGFESRRAYLFFSRQQSFFSRDKVLAQNFVFVCMNLHEMSNLLLN